MLPSREERKTQADRARHDGSIAASVGQTCGGPPYALAAFSAIAGAYATLEDDVLQLYFVFGCVCEVVCWHFMTIFVRASSAVP